MKRILAVLVAGVLLLSAAGCNETPPDVPDNTDIDKENKSVEEQLLSYDSYDVFEDEIYLCDDVYRSDDTLTHGTGSIALPMGQDVLEVKHYDILLCGDGCSPESVVSRASQGYAPVYHVVPDGEIDGNFKVLKFKMEIPEPMLEDIKEQGVYDQITERLESQYYYLLVLDEKHYAYIHLERIEDAEKPDDEAELADAIVKNARINFEPDNEKIKLTIERVIRLAENKGEEITWSDFEMYSGRDIGSGLYIMNYEIDEIFDLMIGGVPGTEPMYIRLVTKADRDKYIDIRTEDVEKFFYENREEKSSSEMLGTNYSEITEINSLPQDKEKAILTGHTVGYSSRFDVFEPGLKYYRYDHGIEKYYECILHLPSEYTGGEIIGIYSGGGSGEVELIVKTTDAHGSTVYLGYIFFISVADPLNDEPMAVLDYTEQDLIDRGVIERKETVIDWEAINGEWYYGFADENGYQFYRLAFDMKTAAMNFDYGFFESEYVNRYAGSFTIDPVSQEITAVLHDSSVMHTDPDITLKFRLASSENSDGAVLVWKMTSCDVEKYRHLIGTSIEFSKNMPSIIELSAVSDGDFKIYTIPQDGDNSLVLKIPKSWYWKTGDFVEDYDGSPAFPTVKRVAYRKTTQTLQEFTDELRATEPGYTQYDMDSPIKGETDAGHTYVGYYGDGEQIKGLHYRRYLFYITTDADAYILEVWQYLDIDGEDFVEEILNQVRKSFYVNVGELPGTSDSDVTPPEKITVQLPEDFVFPITDGSTSTTNLDKAVRNAILGGEQTIAHTKTYTSFQNLLNGKCELIFTTPLSDSQLQTMQERDFRHEAEPVAGEGFVFVVNKDNPVDTLTIEQIKDIYSGKITNWKEVGGNDAEIIAYQRNADSGSQNYMISFMGDTPLMKPVTDQIPASMSGILDVIANYDNGIDAIGYSVYAYSDGMYENISEIKYIKVNGVEPSLTTLADGSYPLLGYNYAVFSADEPEDSNVRTLVKWIQSDEGQQMIADAGFIPYRRVEGLTLPESTTKMLYTAVGTSGVMKPDEMADYYFECNSVPESFTAEGLNEAIAAFIADAEAELAALDKEEMKSFVKSRFQWGFASEDVVIRKTLINGYLSVVVGLRYNEGAQDSPDYYYDVRTAVFDVYTGKRLELSDLFFEELDFTAILNQHLANEAVASYSSMSHITHAMLHDFTGLYEGEFTFTADSIIFKRNTCFADGVVLSLDGMLEHMVTSVPRDMAGYADADTPVYRKIRYGTTSEYAEEKNGITIWYLDKENNSLSEDVCDKINTFIDSLYNVYFTPEKLLESARAIDPGFDKVTIGPFPDFQVSLYGNRYIEIRGANLAFPQKTETGIFDINFTVIQDHHNSAYFAYYFNALTGDELIIGDLFKEGWESEAVYSVYDETYKQRDSGTWTAYTEAFDVKNCRILNVSDYVNAPYNKGDLSDLEMPVTVYIITDNGDKVAVSVPREYIK